ncbi:alpha-galactosidase [bacterium]|nr:alpha-galactosidase [bacterium]
MVGAAPLTLGLADGRLQIVAGGGCAVEIAGAVPELTVDRAGERQRWRADSLVAFEGGWSALWAETGLRVELRVEAAGDAVVLRTTLEHAGEAPLRLVAMAPLAVTPPGAVRVGDDVGRWSVYRNGYQSWSGTRAYGVEEADADPWFGFLRDSQTDVAHRASGRRGVFRSDLVSAIVERGGGQALALGFLDAAAFLSAVEVEAPGGRFRRLAAVVDGDERPLRPGERLALPPLWLAAGADGWALLEQWAVACGAAMQARVPERTPLGWCSWYYYFTRVREADILDNLESLRRLRDRVRCDYVQVDDGYQRAIGDWLEPNGKFPHGMRWLARRIRDAGFDAGIWLAPFLVRPESQLMRARPDWLVRTPRGRLRWGCWNPMWSLGRPAYVLDTTRDDVLDWLREVARTIVHQWGYRLLKLDFLYAAALPGVRADRDATRAEALRRGLQAIREGAGPDAFLLGCGCPLGPAIGVVDGMRIGADVAPYWSNWISRVLNRGRHGVATEHALRNILTRAFMHRRLWLNDPDCLMVRARETRLTPAEVQTLATAIALTDGMFVLSDRLDGLPPERLEWIERVLPLLGGEARVDDLFERDLPERLRAGYPGAEAVGLFNFSRRAAERRLVVAPGTAVRDVWGASPLAVVDDALTLSQVPPHGCRLLWLEEPTPIEGDTAGD